MVEYDVGNFTLYSLDKSMKKLDFYPAIDYDAKDAGNGARYLRIPERGLLIMKLTVRILAVLIVVAGGAAAAVTPKSAHVLPSHQAVVASFPIPGCGPGICPANPPASIR